MESKHTPGPWRIGDAGCTVFGPKTDAPAPKTVASITRNPMPNDEQRANAALIAAAPDMYEALRDMLAEVAPDAGSRAMPSHEAIAQARAALAKATA